MTLETAQSIIDQDLLHIGEVTLQKSEVLETYGKILSQTPVAGSMAILDTNISLTVAVPAALHNAVVSIPIPATAESAPLRVTIVIDNTEVEEYQGQTRVGNAYTNVVLLSVGAGWYVYVLCVSGRRNVFLNKRWSSIDGHAGRDRQRNRRILLRAGG